MKVMILSILLVACAYSSATPMFNGFADKIPQDITVEEKLSPEGRIQLRKAALRMLNDLCLGQQPETTVYQLICEPTLKLGSGAYTTSARSCMSCPVADPICMASCPY